MEKRKYPRVNLSKEQFRLDENGKIYGVIDLSQKGMSIKVLDPEADLLYFSIMRELTGMINIDREKYPVTVVVKNAQTYRIGFEFKELPLKTAKAIEEFLSPKRLGEELRPMHHEKGLIWLHAASSTDVLVEDQKYFSIFVHNSFVQWNHKLGLRTGQIEASDEDYAEPLSPVRLETLLLEPDPIADYTKVKLAQELIHHSAMDDAIKSWILSELKSIS